MTETSNGGILRYADLSDHVHKPVLGEPAHVVYVPVQQQRTWVCATCGCAMFVIPTPEEADEYDRVLEAQERERHEAAQR